MNGRPARSRTTVFLWLLPMLLLPCTRGWAHHAFSAEFDAGSPVTVRGVVTRIEWINPHAWIQVDEPLADGGVRRWTFETGTPNTLVRAGLDRHALPIGTAVVVRGYRSIDPECTPLCRANGRDIAFPDGRKVFVGSTGTGAPPDGADPVERP